MVSVENFEKVKWMLDPEITYLNHGSFGARPVEVFEAQVAFKREFERSPIQFLDREGKERVSVARRTISRFLDCSDEQLGFVENATTGIGCVLQSLSLSKGSEIVSTSHVYNGVRQLLRSYVEKNSCTYREIDIPTPIATNDEIVSRILDGFSSQTTLLVIDHVASVTGIVFPVAKIISACRERGVAVLVDGAHAPGMLDLSINALSPDWYVGNLHKWVCGPPGAGFLWVNSQYLNSTHPMTVSHFYEQGFTNEFDWQGTRDITSILGAAIAVEWGSTIGWQKIRSHNHRIATEMQKRLVDLWGVVSMSPLDGSMIGAMASVQLPAHYRFDEQELSAFQARMYHCSRVEVPLMLWQGTPVVRLSGQLYSKSDDIDLFLAALNG
ncbi:MAG: aminotransferase class V-fold PLP-dependent enzyme [Planctomycetes bacterium]|nr:aminotransferase class V-fold PLP-dependent enzyme [Planctomycetota bacterium]